ncbi:MAG: ATP-dependent helicase HrpB [Deltaproteobacteria bacterium]|nr:ATP-dependent helicase HrpB [Deltaproteobacteria bacterium]
MPRTRLPIDPLLPEIVAGLARSASLVVEAPPGAGKTTRVPPALLADRGLAGEIVVLQPRRLPARLAAARVAEEMGEPVGKTVGYTVRFEDVGGPGTRIRFMTEGILLRRLLAEPALPRVSAVLFDEFHERHLESDLALALLARLQRTSRPELRLVVMSATLASEPVREFLGDCPVARSEGRAFPVDVEHQDVPDHRPLADQVASAVRRLHQEGRNGDVLVFLPGAGEIRRATVALEPFARAKGVLLLPLHGDLPPSEQRRAVTPAAQPKVVLSTNVAETSVTIEGVVAVVDSGLARIASHSPWSGLPRLAVGKISQASAIQRAGRAGRTAPGRALRLYGRHDFASRRPFEIPEIARRDLSEAVLTLAALGVRDASRFEWFEAPGAAALEAATALLHRLGALDGQGGLTAIGQSMLRFAAHPRLARLLAEGERLGVGQEAAALAAMLSEGDISDRARARFGGAGERPGFGEGADLLERLDRFAQARHARFDRDRLRGLGVDLRAVEAAERARRQLAAALANPKAARPSTPEQVDEALALAVLTAFPDRVMKRRGPGADQAVLAGGGAAEVGPTPVGDLLVAVDAEERAGGRPGARGPIVRLAVAVKPDWLLDLAPDGLCENTETRWNPGTQRVETTSRLCYGAVVLEESRLAAKPSPEASRLLAEAALSAHAGEAALSAGSAATLQAKLEILRGAFPELDVPALDRASLRAMAADACEGLTSMAEFLAIPVEERLRRGLPRKVVELLRKETPDHIRLPGGRQVTVNYEAGKPPWVESRLQDFFGMRAGPTICGGRVVLTVHLLAPNHRAVQVTSDLSGFWRNHYPTVRRELGRRYPRHAWPEDGARAAPPAPRPRR